MRAITRSTVAKAKKLRREMTRPEAALWLVLRARPSGLKFRRQHPFGPFVLDSYCPQAKLAIEVDGMAHGMGDNPARDQRRDAWIRTRGIEVLRIPAMEVLGNIERVTAHIIERCLSSPLLPVSEAHGEGHQPKAGGGAD